MSLWAIILVTLAVVYLVWVYNDTVNRRNTVDEALGSVDAMLKRRADLIPAAVEAVARYVKHERSLLEGLVRLRSEAAGLAADSPERQAVEKEIVRGLKGLFALAEGYPQLRAADSFVALQRTLDEVEGGIQAARRFYNTAVRDYENARAMFPHCFFTAGWRKRPMFEIPEEDRKPVDMEALFDKALAK